MHNVSRGKLRIFYLFFYFFRGIIESPCNVQGFFVACSAESLQGARQNVAAALNRGAGFSAAVMCSVFGLAVQLHISPHCAACSVSIPPLWVRSDLRAVPVPCAPCAGLTCSAATVICSAVGALTSCGSWCSCSLSEELRGSDLLRRFVGSAPLRALT